MPERVDFVEAAAFGVAHGTAYHALRSVAEVAPGEWVVVLGAAGGVGLASVELAHLMGAKVLAAAAGKERLAVCEERGADAIVDYRAEDLKARVKELTDGGADVVIDPVGGPYAELALRAMRRRGRFVTVGFASGEIPSIPLNLVLLKGVTIKGFEMLTFMTQEPELFHRDQAELFELFASGDVHPHVSAVFPLDDVREALRAVAERRTTGKVCARGGGLGAHGELRADVVVQEVDDGVGEGVVLVAGHHVRGVADVARASTRGSWRGSRGCPHR